MMTVDEQVILDLQRQIRSLAGQVAELSEWKSQHQGIDIGSAGVNYPHPYLRIVSADFGKGASRLANTGLQLVSPNDTDTGIWMVPQLGSSKTDIQTRNYILIGATVTATQADIEITARDTLQTDTAAKIAIQNDGVSSQWAGVFNVPLYIDSRTSDPTILIDGLVWYRSNTDKFRVRINGVTENLATESYVRGGGTELTIATGAITITTSFHSVDTQSDAGTDDLDTINGGGTGQILVIHAADSTRDVVAKDGTGNLKLAGDCTLDNVEDTLTLIYDGANWLELARSNNGA